MFTSHAPHEMPSSQPDSGPMRLEQREDAPSWDTDRGWLLPCIDGCVRVSQGLRGRDLGATLHEIRAVLATLPATMNESAATLARGAMLQTIGAILQAEHLDDDPCVSRAIMRLLMPTSQPSWREEFLRFLEIVETARRSSVARTGAGSMCVSNVFVRHALEYIHRQYARPGLRLSHAALKVRLTPSHLTTILRRHTGRGFLAHLRACRVEAAQRLLLETTRSIKEIASAVGYEHPRQLERDVKRVCGMTPTKLRARMLDGLPDQPTS